MKRDEQNIFKGNHHLSKEGISFCTPSQTRKGEFPIDELFLIELKIRIRIGFCIQGFQISKEIN